MCGIALLERTNRWEGAAMQWMAAGESSTALDALEHCVKARTTYLCFTAQTPYFRPLHNNPRFQRILQTLKLAATRAQARPSGSAISSPGCNFIRRGLPDAEATIATDLHRSCTCRHLTSGENRERVHSEAALQNREYKNREYKRMRCRPYALVHSYLILPSPADAQRPARCRSHKGLADPDTADRGGRPTGPARDVRAKLWPNIVVEDRTLTVHMSTPAQGARGGSARGLYRNGRPSRLSTDRAGAVLSEADPSPQARGGLLMADARPRAVRAFSTGDLAEDDIYLGVGIADAVTTALGGLPGLTVWPVGAVDDLAGARDAGVGHMRRAPCAAKQRSCTCRRA